MGVVRRRVVAVLVLCAVVQLTGSACALTVPVDVVAAAGWAPDGRLLVATTANRRPVKLWDATPGRDRRQLMRLSYCAADEVLSLFPLPSGRLGMVVECVRPVRRELVAVELATGRVEQLASAPWIANGVWFEAANLGLVEYRNPYCGGVGEVDRDDVVRPLAVTVPLPTGPMPLASALPPPGVDLCPVPGAMTRAAAASPDGRYIGFFLRLCSSSCTRYEDPGTDWDVVVEDRTTGRVQVSGGRFESPSGLALANDGAVAVVGQDDGRYGLWYCPTLACARPQRLTDATPGGLSFRADGRQLVGINDLDLRLYDVP